MTNNWPLQSQAFAFYGDPRQPGWLQRNTTSVECPWPLFVGAIHTSHILIHKKCAASLAKVLNNIWDAAGHDLSVIQAQRYDQYDGSYNFRPMRGGNSLSMHSFACAIDWDAKDNAFHSTRHLFTDQSLLVTKFKEEGWIWGGDWTPGSVDAMHVQAARIHD
jgi:D-alanyl-D-alanine carboxypeptidase